MIRCLILPLALLVAPTLAEQSAPAASPSVTAIDTELAQKLLDAKRIYVDSFGEDPQSKSLTAMVLEAMRTGRRFIVTENRERADLILKGAALGKKGNC